MKIPFNHHSLIAFCLNDFRRGLRCHILCPVESGDGKSHGGRCPKTWIFTIEFSPGLDLGLSLGVPFKQSWTRWFGLGIHQLWITMVSKECHINHHHHHQSSKWLSNQYPSHIGNFDYHPNWRTLHHFSGWAGEKPPTTIHWDSDVGIQSWWPWRVWRMKLERHGSFGSSMLINR